MNTNRPMKKIFTSILGIIFIFFLFSKGTRQINSPNPSGKTAAITHDDTGPYIWPTDTAVLNKLQQWQDWKFGVIIHWGPYSQWGVVESWSLCPEDESWCIRRGPYADDYNQYVSEYEKIRTYFNPDKFNPEKWADACKKAGMKYLVFTTKHHDGFCMFDSKYTDYKITGKDCAFAPNPKSNVVKEVFSAFREQGLGIGAYFSKPDWHCNDYWWPYFPTRDRNVNYDPKKHPEKWEGFKKYTYNQVEELMSEYGSIDILWLDGGWVRPLTPEEIAEKRRFNQDIDIAGIAEMARIHQSGLLVVDRAVGGEHENYRTPEQQIPDVIPDYPWESCITLCDNWYSTGPGERYKSVYWAIHTLVKIVARGGNFLLGIGPDKTGEMVPEVYQRLEEIGKWMDVNSEAIYNTKPLEPYREGKFCFTRSKDGKIRYAIYLVDEGATLQREMVIPEIFVAQSTELGLLGHEGKLQVRDWKGENTIQLPQDFLEQYAGTPAVVLWTSE